jgi:hypothetical protein
MANNYIAIEDIKEHLPDSSLDGETSYDAILTALITRASRAVDGLLKRKPGAFYASTDETRYYTGSGCAEQWIDELAAAPTSVAVAETGDRTSYTAWSSTDWYPWPVNALLDGMPYMRLDLDTLYGSKALWYRYPQSIKVVGPFGFSAAVPSEIEEACIIQVVRWFKRGHQGFQDVGAIADLGQLKYVKKLDPDMETMLDLPRFARMTI